MRSSIVILGHSLSGGTFFREIQLRDHCSEQALEEKMMVIEKKIKRKVKLDDKRSRSASPSNDDNIIADREASFKR